MRSRVPALDRTVINNIFNIPQSTKLKVSRFQYQPCSNRCQLLYYRCFGFSLKTFRPGTRYPEKSTALLESYVCVGSFWFASGFGTSLALSELEWK